MGAIPHENGVTFRVWAPSEVYVTGSFNEWDETAVPLQAEEDSYWAPNVANAAPWADTRPDYDHECVNICATTR